MCLPLKPKDRLPFHWSDKDKPKHVKFFVFGASKPSAPFTIADCGTISLTNVTLDGARHFFRVTKRMVLNSTFIIVEDLENAPYKIDNLSKRVFVSYFQVGCNDINEIEDCAPG